MSRDNSSKKYSGFDLTDLPDGTPDVDLAWDRAVAQKKPCAFGSAGTCCRVCGMGPCRINPTGDKGARAGICGADADTIAARNFARMIAAGTSSHSDHGRGVAEMFLEAAEGKAEGYSIKDPQKLYQVAMDLDIEVGDRSVQEIAVEVGKAALAIFGSQKGPLPFLKRAPLKRQARWKELGVEPRGVDREVVEMMHRTHMGVDQDFRNIMLQGARTALADGWGGSMLATELQDIMFGTPEPLLSHVNLGILKEDEVNIIIHGHEPLLSEMIVAVAQDPEMIAYAKEQGANGITMGGICCTANEILMRHGVPVAGNFLQQETAILTGAVEAMVVDVQCVMQSLPILADCFHTEIISTNPRAKMPGATHVEFDEHSAIDSAKTIVKRAIDNFKNRKETRIPKLKTPMIAGFSHETINYLLGGIFRASYRPLNDNIINGKIRGIAGVVGCNNARSPHDEHHLTMVKELLKHDVIVLQTGCAAVACAKEGLLLPEAAKEFCGPGLAEVCETVGIPPVLHMGSCVDNSRILMAATAVVKEGGLGDDLCELPACGAAPEWMSEKAIAIGQYFVSSGVYTVFGGSFPTHGAPNFSKHLFEEMDELYGGCWAHEPDPIKAAHLMIDRIDAARKALGLDKKKERVLMDMEARRQLEAELETAEA